jgi:hypothetical protein
MTLRPELCGDRPISLTHASVNAGGSSRTQCESFVLLYIAAVRLLGGRGSGRLGSQSRPLWLRSSLVDSVRASAVITIIWHGSYGLRVAHACLVETWRGLAGRGLPWSGHCLLPAPAQV